MPGLCGIIANDSARYSLFASCIDKLTLPDGWKKEWLIGGDWCGARNTLCQLVLDEGYSHLFFMDDDHAFPPSMLTKLLAHDKPLVTPICLTRTHPFAPVQYTEKLDGEFQYLPIPLSESETDGLVEIQAGGCAGMLIHRDVIEAIGGPNWFEYTDRSEDLVFSEKAKAAGFDLWTDLSVPLGHITTAVVFPAVRDGRWITGLTIGKDLNLFVEPAEVSRVWTWELRYERGPRAGEAFVVVQRPAHERVNWLPSGEVPDDVMQWWLDMGDGARPVGDPFTYTLEEAK